LGKKYDEYTQGKDVKKEIVQQKEVKPKKEMKIVYKFADSSSSSSPDNEDEKVFYVKKIKVKSKNTNTS
jgi:hypothetical protein